MSIPLTPIIKRIVVEVMQAQQPVNVVTGKVIQVVPKLLIQTDIKIPLDRDFLMFTQTANNYELKIGDKFVMLKIQGGQTYLVLDKVVD